MLPVEPCRLTFEHALGSLRVGKARPPGTQRLKPGHKSRDFGTTEPNAAFDPACPERAAAAIDEFFKEFSGNQAPETRQWTEGIRT